MLNITCINRWIFKALHNTLVHVNVCWSKIKLTENLKDQKFLIYCTAYICTVLYCNPESNRLQYVWSQALLWEMNPQGDSASMHIVNWACLIILTSYATLLYIGKYEYTQCTYKHMKCIVYIELCGLAFKQSPPPPLNETQITTAWPHPPRMLCTLSRVWCPVDGVPQHAGRGCWWGFGLP